MKKISKKGRFFAIFSFQKKLSQKNLIANFKFFYFKMTARLWSIIYMRLGFFLCIVSLPGGSKGQKRPKMTFFEGFSNFTRKLGWKIFWKVSQYLRIAIQTSCQNFSQILRAVFAVGLVASGRLNNTIQARLINGDR